MASTFQGKRVSSQWATVLTEAARHVKFQLNSGKRTLAEQRALVRQKGLWSYANPHGAASPNPNAPHIRVGRPNHALDIDMYVGGGVRGLVTWLRKQGVRVDFTVPTEGWHIETSAAGLRKLAKAISRWDQYTTHERNVIEEYDTLLKARKNPARRKALRSWMRAERKNIWRAAQKDGWGKHRRRARYRSLFVRSR